MVFSDLFFLFAFIPAFLVCYMLASVVDKKNGAKIGVASFTLKNAVLVAFSLIFYAWGEPMYVFLMLITVFINFMAGKVISQSTTHRKRALIAGLTCNLLILGVFKYANFIAESLNSIGIGIPVPGIALPIGISFYTFQSISYLIDVYRRDAVAQRRFSDLLLYISMFPQLIAGPIVRYGTVAEEINNRHATAEDIADGMYRFFIGLGKKVIIANQLSTVADQFLVDNLNSASTAGVWIGIAAFTLQIYFDFSGYSDMAIGIGRCLGFHFNENFNHPYCCNSVTDFWRRWHMSLGSFFRDYVYIPLGGNRKHQWMNILIVWMLTGIWHGASWNFMFWGLYFAVILVLEKYLILGFLKKVPVIGHLWSLALVFFGWSIFYFDDMTHFSTFFNHFIGHSEHTIDFAAKQAVFDHFWLWIIALILCMPVRKLVERWCSGENSKLCLRVVLSAVILMASVALLVGATNNAFIYTRF